MGRMGRTSGAVAANDRSRYLASILLSFESSSVNVLDDDEVLLDQQGAEKPGRYSLPLVGIA